MKIYDVTTWLTNSYKTHITQYFTKWRQRDNKIWWVRGCLHVKFHPGMKLVPGWNHPCLWWNVSYCLHVFAEMKFHPGMKDRDEISSQNEKKKKRRVNNSSWDEILKWACFFNFWRMYLNMFSKFSMFEQNGSMNIMKHKASL